MNEVFEKIIEKLEEKQYANRHTLHNDELNVGIDQAIEIVRQEAEEYDGGWIPVSERLPEDCDNGFYMCIVENHEEDLPMFCQYCEEQGFGFWNDIYDEYTLGFVDSEFRTNEELGYEKVIAWQPLPESYQGRESE